MSKKRHIFDISNLTVGIIGAAAGVAGLVLAYGVAIGWTPGIFGFGSKDRFSCAHIKVPPKSHRPLLLPTTVAYRHTFVITMRHLLNLGVLVRQYNHAD